MATKSQNRGDGIFVCYSRTLGDRLSMEAKARGISRTQLIRLAADDYLIRYPKQNH